MHLQCFIQLKARIRLSTAIKRFKPHHIELMRGTVEESILYCKKDGAFIEKGTSTTKGERTDLKNIVEAIYNNELSRNDLKRNHAQIFYQYRGGLNEICSDIEKKKALSWRDVYVEIRWGMLLIHRLLRRQVTLYNFFRCDRQWQDSIGIR